MASIVKRRKQICVVYYIKTEDGKRKQIWESFSSEKEALARKAEVEYKQNQKTFIAPTGKTVREFLEDFVEIYGGEKWGVSMYDSQTGLIRNYINPVIGDVKVQDVDEQYVDKFIGVLKKTPPIEVNGRKARTEFLTDKSIEKIVKLLRTAFKLAKRWKLTASNPFENPIIKKTKYKRRDIWDAQTIERALSGCGDSCLYMAMNLAFACSMRIGEILGLRWSRISLTEENIATDNVQIHIDAQLQRLSLNTLEKVGKDKLIKVFPPQKKTATSRVALVDLKTDSSMRSVWVPKTVAYMLVELKRSQEKMKQFLGSEYEDNDLVVCLDDGRPCESKVLEKRFNKLKTDLGLPNVVFHSLRHSSTTYKLKLNHGDIKATQGDTGHSQPDMVTQIYAHILDEDRKINAQRFEAAFYAKPDLRNVSVPTTGQTPIDLSALTQNLEANPELAKQLLGLLLQTALNSPKA